MVVVSYFFQNVLTSAGPQALGCAFDSFPWHFTMTWFLWFGVDTHIYIIHYQRNEVCAYGIRLRSGCHSPPMSFQGAVHIWFMKCNGIIQATIYIKTVYKFLAPFGSAKEQRSL